MLKKRFLLSGGLVPVLEERQICPHVGGLGTNDARQMHIPSTRSLAESVHPPEIGCASEADQSDDDPDDGAVRVAMVAVAKTAMIDDGHDDGHDGGQDDQNDCCSNGDCGDDCSDQRDPLDGREGA